MTLLPAKGTLARRTYFTVLGTSALTIFALIVIFTIALERMELTLSEDKVVNEIEFFEAQLQSPSQTQQVNTQFLELYYQPNTKTRSDLPELLQNIPVPADPEEDEFFVDGKEYQYQLKQLADGKIYAVQDITLIEITEQETLRSLAITSLIIMIASFGFGILASHRITQPLQELSSGISNATPSESQTTIDANYQEQELQNIATAFNTFLNANQDYIERERNLVNIASHELRTPIAICQGALEVIEMRGNLSDKDQLTLTRAKQAMSEMQQNTETLLKLSRGENLEQNYGQISLNETLAQVIGNLSRQHADTTRIRHETEHDITVLADPTLLKMLLNNLLLNALQHSTGNIMIQSSERYFDILSETAFEASPTHSHGLGLFIVDMICKHHRWQLTQPSEKLGVRIVI